MTNFPQLTPERREELLAPIRFPADVVLDTDTFNEMDDQFALTWALLVPEKIRLKAVCAAPFSNRRAATPREGMEKSYQEIHRILELLEVKRESFVFRGSQSYLPDAQTPVESPAARRIIELAHEAKKEGRILYVTGIAACTNIASALLLAPDIIDSIVIVWLGGHAFGTGTNHEFNLYQDVPAAQVLFRSGAAMLHVPCFGAAELLMIMLPELEKRCHPCGKHGAFLYERALEFMHHDVCRMNTIWDIATIACFAVPEAVKFRRISAPDVADNCDWIETQDRPPILQMNYICRSAVYDAMFQAFAGKG